MIGHRFAGCVRCDDGSAAARQGGLILVDARAYLFYNGLARMMHSVPYLLTIHREQAQMLLEQQ
jgi:hypothetical protein